MTDPQYVQPIVGNAQWLAHRYDPGHDAFHFRQTPRDVHRNVTFLTDEYLPPDAQSVVITRGDAMRTPLADTPVHFIFHSGYCCSTMLARAFDVPGTSMGLKEPVLLNDLVGWKRRGGSDQAVTMVLNDSLRLLARPFEPGEATIIKPSNLVNGFAGAMMSMRPGAHALFLYAPLHVYLNSIARKGMTGRLWVRELLTGLLTGGLVNLGIADSDYLKLTDLQVAAVGWLAQQQLFGKLIAYFGGRTMSLNSEALMARPAETFSALSRHFGIQFTSQDVQAVISGPAFTTHSKSGDRFSGKDRRNDQVAGSNLHADEISKVKIWAEMIAANAGISMLLPNPVLDGS